MTIDTFVFGNLDGTPVPGFVLANRAGFRAKVMAYGARLAEMHVPDRHARFADVVLGFDDVAAYAVTDTFFGATCGRYGNRIANGRFTLDGRGYLLGRNDGPHHLHGGFDGFDRQMFTARVDLDDNAVVFTHISPNGEAGYPGEVTASVRYRLADDALEITMTATTTATTIIGLLHHSYWNMAGHASGTIRGQRLRIDAPFYTPLDATLIPTGEIVASAGTPYDMTGGRELGAAIDAIGGVGFDNNFCLAGEAGRMRPVAELDDPVSGRRLEVISDRPGLQVYSAGRFPDGGIAGKAGARYAAFSGIALEPQTFPNSPNVGHFPPVRLEPGETYRHRLIFRFSVR